MSKMVLKELRAMRREEAIGVVSDHHHLCRDNDFFMKTRICRSKDSFTRLDLRNEVEIVSVHRKMEGQNKSK